MTKRVTFRQSDVERALRAAQKAGVPCKVSIDLAGRMICLLPMEKAELAESKNEWDVTLLRDEENEAA